MKRFLFRLLYGLQLHRLLRFLLDAWMPGLTAAASKRLEFLCRSSLRRLGTGFIVKARREQA